MAYPEVVEALKKRREQIEWEEDNLPSISKNFGDDFILLTYRNGKIIKSYKDKRKKDEVIQEAYDRTV